MKKIFILMLMGFIFCSGAYAETAPVLEPYQQSEAYEQYRLRPQNELSKLIYLMDRYKDSEYKVIFDGAEYDSVKALSAAKNYIAKHYNQEDTIEWLKEHAYRSPSGQFIYLLDPARNTKMLYDALVEELYLISR